MKNLEKIVDFVFEGANVADRVAKESGMIGRAAALLPLTDELYQLFSLSSDDLKKEMAGITPEQRQALVDRASQKYDITNDKREGLVEEALVIANELVSVMEKASALVKKWKK